MIYELLDQYQKCLRANFCRLEVMEEAVYFKYADD